MSDILNVTGYKKLCSDLESGCEVAVYAVMDLFEEDKTHMYIQIDASNAFYLTNRLLLFV